ncbi:geobacillin-26 family protein [Paenibacillus elgii]|uniref:geobacillin-26 family protein n=1 Tax=Paenibacillus elgii TaxID=189691 RepID=UPI00203BFF05|nr:geobacillin-26 family protein [Paenibacillus elgii]MCM3273014.1 geobacillin-26 family protein [Paenibacillus elgii]
MGYGYQYNQYDSGTKYWTLYIPDSNKSLYENSSNAYGIDKFRTAVNTMKQKVIEITAAGGTAALSAIAAALAAAPATAGLSAILAILAALGVGITAGIL